MKRLPCTPIKIHFDLNVENYFYMQHFENIIIITSTLAYIYYMQSAILMSIMNHSRIKLAQLMHSTHTVLYLFHTYHNGVRKAFQLAFLTRGFILIRFFLLVFSCKSGYSTQLEIIVSPMKMRFILFSVCATSHITMPTMISVFMR